MHHQKCREDENSPLKTERFQRDVLAVNLQRGRIIAILVIAFEVILCSADVIARQMQVDSRFYYKQYLLMYTLMILVNVLYLSLVPKSLEVSQLSASRLRWVQRGFLGYITFILCWGSVLTLMDQRLYGQVLAFLLNLAIGAVIFYLDYKSILIPGGAAMLILFIGLPFYQSSRDILLGHYVNLGIFLVVIGFASRVVYRNYCTSYESTILLQKSKGRLEEEIARNREINRQLEIANNQLRQLTLMDELTGIPNRRGFRNYIDRIITTCMGKNLLLSVMMIDVDHYKQYNDHYGHEEGDKALIAVANQIFTTIRDPLEFAVRWGGEEFLFTGVYENWARAEQTAEEIRKRVNDLNIPHAFSGVEPYLTISVGVSGKRLDGEIDIGCVIAMADQALYEAKNSGRNCVREKLI